MRRQTSLHLSILQLQRIMRISDKEIRIFEQQSLIAKGRNKTKQFCVVPQPHWLTHN
jgi:hypothetical protein